MRHCLTPLDFTTQELEQLFDLAADIEKNPDKYAHACEGKKIATLFYEPSTRTRLSFEAAMMNLGGKALGFAGAAQSSAAKGESVADTIRVVSCFADIAAIPIIDYEQVHFLRRVAVRAHREIDIGIVASHSLGSIGTLHIVVTPVVLDKLE